MTTTTEATGRMQIHTVAGTCAICAYIRASGQDRVAEINFVEGAVKLGEAAFGTLIGPGFLDHFVDLTADDLPANIRGMRSFVRACLAKPVAAEDFETALCWNMAVAPQVRAASARARSTTTTCCAPSRCRCWSPRAVRTRWCSRPWPN